MLQLGSCKHREEGLLPEVSNSFQGSTCTVGAPQAVAINSGQDTWPLTRQAD